MSSFYVDDCLGRSAMEAEAHLLQTQLTELLASGGFPPRKLCWNSQRVMETIPVQDTETSLPCHLTGEPTKKTLGIYWHPDSDIFQCQVQLKSRQLTNITKRNVLSFIASIYDPLGLLGPAVVKCKLYMQHLWQSNLDWDEALPPNLIEEWNDIAEQLPSLTDIVIRCKIIPSPHYVELEIHEFCDASQLAYGACIYTRCVFVNEDVLVLLITAKSRTAPIKQQTLPQLKLCGAQLLA
ncbi:uncharacterized protein LOC124766275 [Schistocerca piceifrons]|uniref:uncharacterized protein LOC124766275 n=1 Tax=Schistocerca piceifrons TaxID=274613 RepID=UPI001F5EAC1E|nr:uncharacterized protein LOC124766275 [Schistocerca piceifrons]